MRNFGRHLAGVLAALCAALLATTVSAAIFSQGFPAGAEVKAGMIVSLDASERVVPSNSANSASLLGVVVNSASTAIEISGQHKTEVQVASSGVVTVYVSDLNGTIRPGDQIASSPISGIGMRLNQAKAANVIGTAQDTFDGKNGTPAIVKTTGGQDRTVKYGGVAVLVNPSYYTPRLGPLSFLQQAGATIAGHQISAAKAVMATVILVAAILSVAILLYTSVKSSLISIGRNPLAESALHKEVLWMILISLLILGTGLGLIYVILRA